jgi:ubiquinone/menaquinone biosynthesis C-methylase UbiE
MSITDMLNNYYSGYDEEGRLLRRWGSIEYLTTMRYIERYLFAGAKIAEIGAATGRYSRAVADMGFEVEAVELTPHNIAIFKENLKPEQKINIHQGNALDLHMFADNSFDLTLVLGPMYHLFTPEDKHRAIAEALRVTKPRGVVFAAYCISDNSLINSGFNLKHFSVADYIQNGKIDPITFDTLSTPEDIFELVRKEDIGRLMAPFNVERLHYVATDLLARFMQNSIDEMDDETFALYLRHHFAICERADMAGLSTHTLDIFRKL